MILIHNYSPLYTRKLIELGMAQKGDGFKISQHFCSKPEMLFNTVAQPGGELYDIVKEYGSCFYIDRLQGGTYYSDYPYSIELQKEYDRLTDGHYLGVQLHELGETRVYDWHRIVTELAKAGLPRSEENILECVRAVSHNKEFPHFSQGSAGEYAARSCPKTLNEFYDDIDSVIKSRMTRFHGRIVNCDSCGAYPGLERENGMPLSFSEIGGLTLGTNYQIALRRGMSRAAGKPWGVYLEPWGVDGGLSAYCFMKNGINEWNINKENFAFETKGGDGGTSMSFARRMMYYSLFAGAEYFAEEWGQANTFYDDKDFVLSPYGEIKRVFFADSRFFNHVKPTVPIAVIIPNEMKMLNHQFSYPYENDICDTDYRDLFQSFKCLFNDGVKLGFEDIYFGSSVAGGLIDIIYDDSYAEKSPYELVIDYSHRLSGANVIDPATCPNLRGAVKKWVTGWLPVSVESTGGADIQLFQNNGSDYVCVYNHNGITKNVVTGEKANHEADVELTVKTKTGKITEVFNPCGCRFTLNADAAEAHVSLPAGTFILLQYR